MSGKTYRGAGVAVTYDARIQPDNAPAESVAEALRRCPTGARHYALAAGDEEVGEGETRVTPQLDPGRRGQGDAGRPLPLRGSGNKPFCDGTHSKIGWRG